MDIHTLQFSVLRVRRWSEYVAGLAYKDILLGHLADAWLMALGGILYLWTTLLSLFVSLSFKKTLIYWGDID